jgi:hypothetical protein
MICPICGSDVIHGYGLAYGPDIGVYVFCTDKYSLGCEWSVKYPDLTIEVETKTKEEIRAIMEA